MRSITRDDDRSTRARIRDAAIDCYGRLGISATTVRAVAAEAGVSAGTVIHHFDSMDGLRAACDEFVVSNIRRAESKQFGTGSEFDPIAAWQDAEGGRMGAYLARVLVDNSPAVARLIDDLVADAEDHMGDLVESGQVQPSANPRGRAVVLTLWSLGIFALHEHAKRLLGVDLTEAGLPGVAIDAYAGPAYEILSHGIFSEPFSAHAGESPAKHQDSADRQK